jgi:hypothetical protein
MKIKLGALSLIAAAVASASAAASALALTNGHFTSEAGEHHVIIKGTEAINTPHHILVYDIRNEAGHPKANSLIEECTHVVYHGTLSGAATTTSSAIQIRPNYNKCATFGAPQGEDTVVFHAPAACGTNVFELTNGSTGTVHLNCTITITREECEITIPPQTAGSVTYTTTTENLKHALIANVKLTTLSASYHAGLCVLLGIALR